MRRWLKDGLAATSRLSGVEIASAVARRAKEGAISAADRDRILAVLVRDLEAVYAVELTEEVARRARELLVRRSLRAGDAVQLASCLMLGDELRHPIPFAAFDTRLLDAARAEGLETLG